MSKDCSIIIRCNEGQRDKLKSLAKAAGLTLTEWVLKKGLEEAVYTTPETVYTKEKDVYTTPKVIKTVDDAIKQLPPAKPKTSTRWNERPLAPGALLKRK